MMKQIVYLSSAVSLLDEDELVELLRESRIRNQEHDITGILLYSEGAFIQVIEGPEKEIDLIYKSIENDKRHTNLIKLVDGEISQKNFKDWTMGFSSVSAKKTKDLVGYIRSTDHILNCEDQSAAILMLKTFISTNKLIITY